jgi:hypothetical protein
MLHNSEALPPNVAEAVYKWLSSKEMTKKMKNTARNDVQYKVQQFIKEDIEKVQAIPEEGELQ